MMLASVMMSVIICSSNDSRWCGFYSAGRGVCVAGRGCTGRRGRCRTFWCSSFGGRSYVHDPSRTFAALIYSDGNHGASAAFGPFDLERDFFPDAPFEGVLRIPLLNLAFAGDFDGSRWLVELDPHPLHPFQWQPSSCR